MTQLTIPTSLDGLHSSKAATRVEVSSRVEQVRHYRIGTVAVSLQSDLPRVQQDFHATYRPYRLERAPSDTFHIDVLTKRSWRTGRRYFHILGNGEELFVTRRPDAVLPHVEWALNGLVARYLPGYLQIHAAVMCYNGVGVVFPGSPGQGKSTLAAGLLARGWAYLSDEFALIDPQTQLLTPYPKALCIKEGSFGVVRDMGLPIDLSRVHYKGAKGRVVMLDPLAVRHDAISEPCRIGAVVFPQYGQGKSAVMEPISRAQAVFELVRVSFNFAKFRQRGFDLLVDVVRQARCFQLRTDDLTKTGELLESYLKNPSTEEAK